MAHFNDVPDNGVDEEVLQAYDCRPTHIRRHDDVWQLFTQNGQYALRQVHCSRASMQAAFLLSERLAAKDCEEASPRMVRTRYGDPFVRDGEVYYYLTAWPRGTSLDPTNASQLERVVQALAAWQQAARFDMATERVTGPARGGAFDEQTEGAGWISHGCFTASNIRLTKTDCVILHYESAVSGNPLYDLACFLSDVMPQNNWDTELLDALARTYAQCLPELDWSRGQLAALLHDPLRADDTAPAAKAITFLTETEVQPIHDIAHADMPEQHQELLIQPASAIRMKRDPIRIRRYRPKPEQPTRKKNAQPEGLHLFIDKLPDD